MKGASFKKLMRIVLENSESNVWREAVEEWEICDCEEDESCSEECICGKENIKYLYKIRNMHNGRLLFPVGSSCIKKFDRADLRKEITLREQLFKLLHAVEEDRYILLSSEFFSRNLLAWLYEQGAFNTGFNNFKGEEDYKFMLKMFNTKDKDSISAKREGKIKAIMVNAIKPFLKKRLSEKVR